MFNKNTYRLSDETIPESRWGVKIGEKYGKLTVIEAPVYLESIKAKDKKTQYVLSKCDCGENTFRRCFELKSGKTYACRSCTRISQLNKIRKGTLAKNGIKQCSKCLKELSINDFYTSKLKTDGYRSCCINCDGLSCMKNTYKITDLELKKLLTSSNLYCKICNKLVSINKTKDKTCSARIDHNHKTNKVRDILCHYCNLGLGHFMDNPELLENAALYLRKHTDD